MDNRFLDSYELAPPNKQMVGLRPGDFVLFHLTDWFSTLISIGEILILKGKNKRFSYWNHAAVVLNECGDLAECRFGRRILSNIGCFDDYWYAGVKIKTSDDSRIMATSYALDLIGFDTNLVYRLLTSLRNILSSLFAYRINFGLKSWYTPGGFVAKVLGKTEVFFDRDDNYISPADLASAFNVERPKSS